MTDKADVLISYMSLFFQSHTYTNSSIRDGNVFLPVVLAGQLVLSVPHIKRGQAMTNKKFVSLVSSNTKLHKLIAEN